MPMVMRFFILALWSSAWPVQAETGKGTVEDPVTRDYIRGVFKDWQEGVVLHPETGNYIVTYKDSYGFFNSVIFDPATKIDPVLKSKVNFAKGGISIAYEYKLKSRTEGRQHIRALRTEITSLDAGSLVTPEGWRGAAATNYQSTGLPILLNWSHRVSGLAPGKSEKGFRLESLDLPGIANMRIEGDATRTTWLGNAPEVDTPAGIQMVEFRDFVPRLAAIPRIFSPTPFNAAVVLGGIQNHIKEEMVSMQLLDPALLASIDRSLSQAIAAAQGGNTTSLLYEIKNLRQLLKQEHADVDQEDDGDDDDKEKEPKPRIDKLAARVLDFDLKYIEKRVKGDKD